MSNSHPNLSPPQHMAPGHPLKAFKVEKVVFHSTKQLVVPSNHTVNPDSLVISSLREPITVSRRESWKWHNNNTHPRSASGRVVVVVAADRFWAILRVRNRRNSGATHRASCRKSLFKRSLPFWPIEFAAGRRQLHSEAITHSGGRQSPSRPPPAPWTSCSLY